MKILQINTVCGTGSTGSIATDIAMAAEQMGHKCYIAYGQGITKYVRSYKIGSCIENHFHNLGSRLWGNQGHYTRRGTQGLIRYIEMIQPDVIHLHNLHGNYLNLPILFDYLHKSSRPVVLTLHDCWAFTGKCSHYTAVGCFKWQTGCSKCPQYRSYPPSLIFDRSAELYRHKKQWFSELANLHIVTVSKWLQHEVENSFLAKWPISQIYNWVDSTKFHKAISDRSKIMAQYDLSDRYKYVVSVSAGWDRRSSKFEDAVALSKSLPEGYRLLLVGRTTHGTSIPDPIVHIPYISNSHELSVIYSLASAYVHLSVEDTFGKVIAEAMACGTLPIVFNSTACPEVADRLGITVAPHDISAIVEALSTLNVTQEHQEALISYVREHYNIDTNVRRYINLYEQLAW